MLKQLIIIPRWGGGPSSDWYPRAKKELVEMRSYSRVEVIDMPNQNEPTIESWTKAVSEVLITNETLAEHTVLVGHSVGFQAVLHALEKFESKNKLSAIVGIAAWQDIDNPWATLVPWVNFKHNFDVIRQKSHHFDVLISDNDPFTADFRRNADFWKASSGAKVSLAKGAHHFNAPEQTEVMDLLKELGRT